jgi:hypothetical protein
MRSASPTGEQQSLERLPGIGIRGGVAVAEADKDELAPYALERCDDRGELDGDVPARTVLGEHALDAADLAFGATQPSAKVVGRLGRNHGISSGRSARKRSEGTNISG